MEAQPSDQSSFQILVIAVKKTLAITVKKHAKLDIRFLKSCPIKFEYAEFNCGSHFFLFDQKYPFWAIFVRKINIINLS